MIRPVKISDAARIADIYNYYVAETIITFEEVAVSTEEMARRIQSKLDNGFPWIVSEQDGRLIGYAYAGTWRERVAYRHTVETAVYLDIKATGNGFGTDLYQNLLDRLRAARNIHSVIGMISVPNPGSIKLHTRLGFRETGVFHQSGLKFGKWIDVYACELLLDCDIDV